MNQLIEFFKLTGPWVLVVLGIWVILNFIGEILDKKNKIVPEFMKIITHFKKKKTEKQEQKNLLKNVQLLLDSVNKHYSDDNISQRNEWMQSVNDTMKWVHTQADVYDSTIKDIKLDLEVNRKIAEKLFVQNCRTTILDFASKVGREDYVTTKDEFRRVFNVYEDYERFLSEHNMENGEVDDAMEVIRSEHIECIRQNKFLEARRQK